MMRFPLWLTVSAAVLVGCGGTPESALVDRAASALGDVEDARTLVMDGTGQSYWLGEAAVPGGDMPMFESLFKRIYDWENRRMRVEESRKPTFVTGSQTPQRIIKALDNEHAFDVDRLDKAARLPDYKLAERQAELFHHPVGAVRAAMAEGSTLANLRTEDGQEAVDVTTAEGAAFTLFVDPSTGLPSRVASKASHPYLGDIVLETLFAEYQEVEGVQLPTKLTERIDGRVVSEITAGTQDVNAEVGRLEAPRLITEAPQTAPVPQITAEILPPATPPGTTPAPTPTPTGGLVTSPAPVEDTREPTGVWYLKADNGYFSVLVEFADHLALVEAPFDEALTRAMIGKARELVPGKKLTHVVVTHHHLDHVGGVRAAVAEGLTLVVHENAREFVTDLVSRAHTIAPDALASAPRTASIEAVGEKYVMQDETRTLEVYPVVGSSYADTLLMAYLPREKMLIEADIYTPADPLSPRLPEYPYAQNLIDNIQKYGLAVELVVPLHGRVVTYETLVDAAESEARRTAPVPTQP